MMKFVDRIEEKKRILSFLSDKEGGLACLYGRRRCGKTRLLEECLADRVDTFYYLADRTERSAQIARLVREASVLYPALAAAGGRDWGSVLDLWVAVSPPGSVLVFDEFPYLAEQDEALTSVLQRIVDRNRETGRKIVICGSSQRMMQGFVLKASEPLYGRARVILPIAPLEFAWLKVAFPKFSAMERLRLWGVWGGVPRYWEMQERTGNLIETLADEVFSPLGVLRNEPEHLLLDDVGDVAQAATVLSFIGEGAHRLSEIAARMGRPVTDMSRPIKRLVDLGLIERESPFGEGERSKRSFYRISDSFLDFWYAFVRPNWSDAGYLADKAAQMKFKTAYGVFLGGVWERLVRRTLSQKSIPGMKSAWRNVHRWWGTAVNRMPMEIDVVAESTDGSTLLVGECKLRLTRREAEHECAELKKKAELLPCAANYRRVETRLFVAEGGDFDCVDLGWCEQ